MGFKTFWDWFYAYREAYYFLQDFSEEEQAFYYNALDTRLKHFHSNLSYVLLFAKDGELAEFILTTNGRSDGMLLVSHLVLTAPTIPQWRITAFIQPTLDLEALKLGTDGSYDFKGCSIRASEILWCPVDFDFETGKHDLLLCFKTFKLAYTYLTHEALMEYIFIILLDLLGELVVIRQLGLVNFDVIGLSDLDWYGLDTLPGYLDGNAFDY